MVESYISMDADFLLLDGLESVTVSMDRPGGGVQEVSVEYALKRAVSYRDRMRSDITVSESGRTWYIRSADLGEGMRLETNDVITDSESRQWKVQSVDQACFETQFKAICNELRRNS